jgi:hypothetical protein
MVSGVRKSEKVIKNWYSFKRFWKEALKIKAAQSESKTKSEDCIKTLTPC